MLAVLEHPSREKTLLSFSYIFFSCIFFSLAIFPSIVALQIDKCAQIHDLDNVKNAKFVRGYNYRGSSRRFFRRSFGLVLGLAREGSTVVVPDAPCIKHWLLAFSDKDVRTIRARFRLEQLLSHRASYVIVVLIQYRDECCGRLCGACHSARSTV